MSQCQKTTCIRRLPISVKFPNVVKPNVIFCEQTSMHHLKLHRLYMQLHSITLHFFGLTEMNFTYDANLQRNLALLYSIYCYHILQIYKNQKFKRIRWHLVQHIPPPCHIRLHFPTLYHKWFFKHCVHFSHQPTTGPSMSITCANLLH